MRTYIIIIMLLVALGFTVYSSVKLINTTTIPVQQGRSFSLNFTETFVIDHSGVYLIKLNNNISSVKSLYVIAILGLNKDDHRVVVLTSSSPSALIHLHKGVYQVQFYVTGIFSGGNFSTNTLMNSINLSVIKQTNGQDQ
ncbi:hypothetical protein [Metallosphaera hakonensis]|uniref:Uncharacterized protein n=1 Tax=Metallosphaera hakonensis JCM 8857 = DSM 7519 TaxID=1293036 RepID=A0A2U9ISN3_9CREN|nr:hypothetical protein [Metallosphaera hakonensis]AWR98952.1 hypothetical protein DFR87_03730 [Metallosphaera hakonensis JCM 8857 = DSM 7519]